MIERVFDAPRELVFKAWTDPDLIARWWGPALFTTTVHELDARPGGAIRLDMHGPDGVVYPMKGTFHEVAAPERLVVTSTAVEDDAGNPGLEVLNIVTFAEQDGKTKLALSALAVKVAPAAVWAVVGMKQGWSESLDRLAQSLAEMAE